MKTQLTAEESAKLIELGVSPERASERTPDYTDLNNTGRPLERREPLPIFTIADILDILPKEVKIHRDGDALSMIYHCGQWRVGYSNCAEYCNHTKVAPELIDALYSLLVWCLEKGREEAIHNISVVTDELEDIMERREKAIAASCPLPIVNIHDNINPIDEAARKSYVSPYAKFDKYHKKKRK